MPDTIAAHLAALKLGHTWREVAHVLGGQYSGSFWRLIARGERHATPEQENIVRDYLGLEKITETPAEAIERAGIDRVVECSKRPNTALFVAVSGEVTRVNLKVSKTGDDVPATIPVTLSYSHTGKRKRGQGASLSHMDEIANLPPDSFRTTRGKSGNLEAISAAALVAAGELRG